MESYVCSQNRKETKKEGREEANGIITTRGKRLDFTAAFILWTLLNSLRHLSFLGYSFLLPSTSFLRYFVLGWTSSAPQLQPTATILFPYTCSLMSYDKAYYIIISVSLLHTVFQCHCGISIQPVVPLVAFTHCWIAFLQWIVGCHSAGLM